MNAFFEHRSRLRGQSGAAAVEFALVLPVLLLLLFGIIEFGRLMTTYSTVRSAGREAARYGSAVGQSSNGVPRYADCTGIRAAAKDVAVLPGLSDGDIDVAYDGGPGTNEGLTCPVGGTVDPNAVVSGSRIVVTVSTTFDAATPLVGALLDGKTVTSTTRRTIRP
jgi:Flp pilus assembly protein TadG